MRAGAVPTVVRRAQILDVALGLTDELGLEQMTMRRVAERVGMSPMGLYRHVANRAEMLDALVGRLLEPVAAGDLPRDWPARLQVIAQRLLDAARTHPAAFTLVLSRPYRSADAIAAMRTMYDLLEDAGVEQHEIPRLERFLSVSLIGYAVAVSSTAFWNDDSPTDPPMQAADQRWQAELRQNVDDLATMIRTRRHPAEADHNS